MKKLVIFSIITLVAAVLLWRVWPASASTSSTPLHHDALVTNNLTQASAAITITAYIPPRASD